MRPDSMGNITKTAVFLAVLTQPRATVRSVAEEVGRSTGVVHKWIVQLRSEGLVDYTDRGMGTLRPTVGIVVGATLAASNNKSLS